MKCPIGHENPEGKNFCGECGALLAPQSHKSLPGPPRSARSWYRAPWVLAAAAVLLLVGITAAVLAASGGGDGRPDAQGAGTESGGEGLPDDVSVDSTRFELAFGSCTVTSQDIEVADSGTSIIMDGPADNSNQLTEFLTDLYCVLAELEVPDFVIHNLENTTSLMGLQQAEWSGIHAQWSYHPDNGLDLVLTDSE